MLAGIPRVISMFDTVWTCSKLWRPLRQQQQQKQQEAQEQEQEQNRDWLYFCHVCCDVFLFCLRLHLLFCVWVESLKVQGPRFEGTHFFCQVTVPRTAFLPQLCSGFVRLRFEACPLCIFYIDMAVCQNPVPLVNIKIAGKWMFIPLELIIIGFDPPPYQVI